MLQSKELRLPDLLRTFLPCPLPWAEGREEPRPFNGSGGTREDTRTIPPPRPTPITDSARSGEHRRGTSRGSVEHPSRFVEGRPTIPTTHDRAGPNADCHSPDQRKFRDLHRLPPLGEFRGPVELRRPAPTTPPKPPPPWANAAAPPGPKAANAALHFAEPMPPLPGYLGPTPPAAGPPAWQSGGPQACFVGL